MMTDTPKPPWHWPARDQALGLAALTAQAGDWLTTVDMARHPEGFHENNPLLGKHPSVGTVNTANALAALGNLGINSLVGDKARPWTLGALALLESLVTAHNRSHGLHFNVHI